MLPKEVCIRRATLEDVAAIVRITNAGGPDGKPRSELPQPIPPIYFETFKKIDATPDNEIMVVDRRGEVVGTFHLTYLRYLAAGGREDLQIEAVHVSEEHRNSGVGSLMMTWAIDQARRRGCRRVQLTTNKLRKDAHRFYRRLGFEDSHEGMKLCLD